MRRRQPRFTANGVLVVDKPAGPTSHDLVDRLRRRFKPAKLGHAGTLDPFATGVLVLAFNQATRLSDLLGRGDKIYRAGLALGRATDTGDPTGQVVAEAPVPRLSQEQAQAALDELLGSRLQAPPAFSAAKHQGRPLYAYAREGVKVEKPPRPIMVGSVRLLALEPGGLEFELTCSRGTYVRALAEELAQRLGTVGHLESLRRLASQPFGLDQAVELDQAAAWTDQQLQEGMLSPSEALARCGLPAVSLNQELIWQLRQGQILPRELLLAGGGQELAAADAFRVLSQDGELAAVLRWLPHGQRRPGRDYETIRVFPEQPEGGSGTGEPVPACGAE